MALPPPSASNEEVRTAIRFIRKYTGHNLTFKRGKRGYDLGKGIVYDTWPSATCKDCGLRFIWDTYQSNGHGIHSSWYKGSDPENFWRVNRNGKNHIDDIPSCNHLRMLEALE